MKRYDNIQVLRVLACIGVFVTHLAPRMGAAGWLAKAANFGASGVYLFFLISGFLACCAKDIDTGGWRGVLAYYCKRLFRILPLYYAVILYNMALHGLILHDVPKDPEGLSWLRYFLLTNAFIPGPDNFWSNLSATWTVSLFCFFYLCAPLFVRLIGKKWVPVLNFVHIEPPLLAWLIGQRKGAEKQSGTGNIRRAAFLYLAALLLRYVWVGTGLSSYMMAFYYLHFFVLGMLVHELSGVYRPLTAAVRFLLLASATGIVLELSGAGNDYFTVVSWIFALIVLASVNFTWNQAKNAISCRMARLIGVLDEHSYAIYLVHAVIIDGIVLLQAHVELSGIAVFILAVGLTAAGAYFAHLLIEKPAEKLGRRLVTRLRI